VIASRSFASLTLLALAACGSGSGTPSGGKSGDGGLFAGDGGNGDCNVASNGICLEEFPIEACPAENGAVVSACPTADLLGCCVSPGTTACFYAPEYTMGDVTAGCEQEMGTVKTSP
jgi:hypothetical protein